MTRQPDQQDDDDRDADSEFTEEGAGAVETVGAQDMLQLRTSSFGQQEKRK